jgi:hypothetical protein
MAGEKGGSWANSLLQLVFNATPMTGVAANSGSPITSVFVSLHTADPTSAGSQTSSEMTTGAYAGYARVGVLRTTGGWTVTGNSVSPVANISFPAGTGGTGATASFWGVGTLTSGTGVLLYAGPISPTIVCGAGITPVILTTAAITES